MASDETAAPARAPRALGALALLLALASGGYGAGFWLTSDRGPGAAAIAEAAGRLRAAHRPGDVIFLVPFHATRAREFLGDLDPLAVRDPLAEDLERHPRAWVLGLFGEGEALRARFVAAGLRPVTSERVGEVTVDLYETPRPAEVVVDFLEALPRARVWHERGAERVPCAEWSPTTSQGARRGRWLCPHDREWFFVAPEWHRMGEHPRLCLWAHPPGEGRLVISYPGVALAPLLAGRAGHTLNGSLHARAPVALDVSIDDGAPQRFVFGLEEHFRPFRLAVPGVDTATVTRTGTVTFAVSATDAGANHFCFVADLRRPGGTPR